MAIILNKCTNTRACLWIPSYLLLAWNFGLILIQLEKCVVSQSKWETEDNERTHISRDRFAMFKHNQNWPGDNVITSLNRHEMWSRNPQHGWTFKDFDYCEENSSTLHVLLKRIVLLDICTCTEDANMMRTRIKNPLGGLLGAIFPHTPIVFDRLGWYSHCASLWLRTSSGYKR